nr:hypothetical protein [Tanacetum cinerariifolium]
MAPLTFADTHNMVVFLSKSDASADFDQILDFLNAQVIQYALMVGNGYSRNGQKPGKKRQNQTQNGKDRKRRSKSKPEDISQTFGQQKSTLKVKVNPGNVKVNPDKKTKAEK